MVEDYEATLAFEVAHHLGHDVFWEYPDKHMDVIETGLKLIDDDSFSLAQLPQDSSDFELQLAENNSSPILCNKSKKVPMLLHGYFVCYSSKPVFEDLGRRY